MLAAACTIRRPQCRPWHLVPCSALVRVCTQHWRLGLPKISLILPALSPEPSSYASFSSRFVMVLVCPSPRAKLRLRSARRVHEISAQLAGYRRPPLASNELHLIKQEKLVISLELLAHGCRASSLERRLRLRLLLGGNGGYLPRSLVFTLASLDDGRQTLMRQAQVQSANAGRCT